MTEKVRFKVTDISKWTIVITYTSIEHFTYNPIPWFDVTLSYLILSLSYLNRVQGHSHFKPSCVEPVKGMWLFNTNRMALYDPFGVDVPLNFDITHLTLTGTHTYGV